MSGPARGCFVTGTDTGVGKTLVGCAIVRALRARGLDVGVFKPIETGVIPTPFTSVTVSTPPSAARTPVAEVAPTGGKDEKV